MKPTRALHIASVKHNVIDNFPFKSNVRSKKCHACLSEPDHFKHYQNMEAFVFSSNLLENVRRLPSALIRT